MAPVWCGPCTRNGIGASRKNGNTATGWAAAAGRRQVPFGARDFLALRRRPQRAGQGRSGRNGENASQVRGAIAQLNDPASEAKGNLLAPQRQGFRLLEQLAFEMRELLAELGAQRRSTLLHHRLGEPADRAAGSLAPSGGNARTMVRSSGMERHASYQLPFVEDRHFQRWDDQWLLAGITQHVSRILPGGRRQTRGLTGGTYTRSRGNAATKLNPEPFNTTAQTPTTWPPQPSGRPG